MRAVELLAGQSRAAMRAASCKLQAVRRSCRVVRLWWNEKHFYSETNERNQPPVPKGRRAKKNKVRCILWYSSPFNSNALKNYATQYYAFLQALQSSKEVSVKAGDPCSFLLFLGHRTAFRFVTLLQLPHPPSSQAHILLSIHLDNLCLVLLCILSSSSRIPVIGLSLCESRLLLARSVLIWQSWGIAPQTTAL